MSLVLRSSGVSFLTGKEEGGASSSRKLSFCEILNQYQTQQSIIAKEGIKSKVWTNTVAHIFNIFHVFVQLKELAVQILLQTSHLALHYFQWVAAALLPFTCRMSQ